MPSLIDTYSRPSAAELAGHEGACRYISHTPGKALTLAEVKWIHGLGKTVVPNFEDAATRAQGGAGAGKTDGRFVVAELRKLRCPEGVCCYASVDYEVHSGAPLATAKAYFAAYTAQLHAAGYLSGAYGDYDLIRALLDSGLVDMAWQCAAWSYGKTDSRDRLLQDVYAKSYDVDQIENDYYGGWTPTGAQEAPVTEKQFIAWMTAWAKSAQGQSVLAAAVWDEELENIHMLNSAGKPAKAKASQFLTNADRFAQQAAQSVADPAAFAKALVAALPASARGGLTEADVEAAVKKVFADAAS